VDFRKGAIVRIDVDALPPGQDEPRWNLKPRSRAIVEGAPARESYCGPTVQDAPIGLPFASRCTNTSLPPPAATVRIPIAAAPAEPHHRGSRPCQVDIVLVLMIVRGEDQAYLLLLQYT